MGALAKPELLRQLAAKTEESLFALFEWTDAEFRFREEEPDVGNVFPVDLRVEDILLKGAQRSDEVLRIRTVFNDPGIVLRRTGKLPPAEVFRNRMTRGLYESVNGERTVAEFLLHAHASEYLVTKFLFDLHRIGAVEVSGHNMRFHLFAKEASYQGDGEQHVFKLRVLTPADVIPIYMGQLAHCMTFEPGGPEPPSRPRLVK